jgi:eukaryotic-like serine/threonine-protein kinase
MDRDFLFGVIAVQLGQATPQQVMAAASGYVADKSKSLPERLRAEGVFTDERFAMLSAMVDEALKAHGGDVNLTLHSLGGEAVVFRSFGGSLVVDDRGQMSIAPSAEDSSDGADAASDVTAEHVGRYRFQGDSAEAAELGRGGIGRVLLAHDRHLGRDVALKELLGDPGRSTAGTPPSAAVSRTRSLVARFLREARVTGQLEHPNIVPVYEVGQHADGTFYYTMRIVHGRTMAAVLKASRTLGERLGLLGHYLDLCNAMAYAHSRGVVHRDIKPENVMLGEFGETVVLDWGLAKVRGKKDIRSGELESELKILQEGKLEHTIDGSAIGTPAYMSPEQADGQVEAMDAQSDVWSLGAVLYELLTGRPPFEGATPFEIIGKVLKEEVAAPKAIDPRIPAELSAVALKALSRDKAQRYQQTGDLSRDVRAFMTGGRISAYEYSAFELLRGFVARHKGASALTAAILVLLVVGAALLWASNRKVIAERDRAQRSEQLSALNLAAALEEKSERLFEERRILPSRIYAAAALVQHPCNTLGILDGAQCERQFPGASELRTLAVSTLFQSGLSILATPGWVEHTSAVQVKLDLSADGRIASVSTIDGKVQLWDLPSRRLLTTVVGSPIQARDGVALSADGHMLATCRGDDTVVLWDTQGNELGTLEQRQEAAGSARRYLFFERTSGELATSNADGSLAYWDVGARRLVRTLDSKGPGTVRALSPDGTLALKSDDSMVELWDVVAGKRLWHADSMPLVRRAAFSPDGRVVAVARMLPSFFVLDAKTGERLRELTGHRGSVHAVAFSPDGRFLVSASPDKTIRVWDARSFEPRYVLEDLRSTFSDVEYLPDGGSLASVSDEGSLRIWRADEAQLAPVLEGASTGRTWDVEFSPDGSLVASAGGDGHLRIGDAKTGAAKNQFGLGSGESAAIGFFPDGRRVVSSTTKAGPANGIAVWDVLSGQRLASVATGDIFAVRISPDGRMLASTHAGGTTTLWNAESLENLGTVETSGVGQYRACFSPDSRQVATAGADKSVRLWDVQNHALVKKLEGRSDTAYNFAFSADGKRLLVAGFTGSLALWDVETGSKIREFKGHERWVNAVAFVPGDEMFASASDDATVRLWRVATGETLLIVRTSRAANDVAVRPDGTTLGVIDGTGVKLYPIDLTIRSTDPRKLLEQAESGAGMKLEGFSLVPVERK